MTETDIFKRCPLCGATWPDRDSFLRDSELKLIGYQADFSRLELGLLLFNHVCSTTLSLKVAAFKDLYDGPVFKERKTGNPECLGLCLKRSELAPCPAKCECAYVREIMRMIQGWGKAPLPRKSED